MFGTGENVINDFRHRRRFLRMALFIGVVHNFTGLRNQFHGPAKLSSRSKESHSPQKRGKGA